MSVIEEQIEVAVPVRTAYNQWARFQSFPEFMQGVHRVEQSGDLLTHWVTEIGGVRREFDARIEHQVPDERISWRVVDGPKHDGTVSFMELAGGRTQVSLRLEYEPEGGAEPASSPSSTADSAVSGRVLGDLRRFKELVEEQGEPTGQWRGEVRLDDPS